jgi:transcriptional regulator with XRE-family HTH domain
MEYGKAIRDIRVNVVQQTQYQFAENLGISPTHLSLVENGNKKPSLYLLERIAEYSEIPMPILFWKGLTIKDVKSDKQEYFNRLKDSIDNLISAIFEK